MSIESVMPFNQIFFVLPLSSCLQSFPASGYFLINWIFASGGQSIGALASASVLPKNIQGWFPLGWTGLISLSPRDSQESSPAPQFESIDSSGAHPNQFSSVQSLSCVWLFATPWTAACQASLSITNSQSSTSSRSLLKLMSIESVMHSTILFSVVPFTSHLQSFPASGSFQMSQFFASGGQSTGVSASTSVLPMNIQDWSPLGWTGWISLHPKGLSRVFFNTTVQKHNFFSAQLSL